MKRASFTACALVALASCRCGDGPADGPPGAVRALVEKAGVADAFRPTDASNFGAGACEAGVVDELHVTVCAWADAKGAETAVEKMEGVLADDALTTVVQQHGNVAVAVVDEDQVDPNGKAIGALLKRFGE